MLTVSNNFAGLFVVKEISADLKKATQQPPPLRSCDDWCFSTVANIFVSHVMLYKVYKVWVARSSVAVH